MARKFVFEGGNCLQTVEAVDVASAYNIMLEMLGWGILYDKSERRFQAMLGDDGNILTEIDLGGDVPDDDKSYVAAASRLLNELGWYRTEKAPQRRRPRAPKPDRSAHEKEM
jgi:hypothetical protein